MDAGTTARAQTLRATAAPRPGGRDWREKSAKIRDCNLPDSDDEDDVADFPPAVTLHFRHRTSGERFAVHRTGATYRAGLMGDDPRRGDVIAAAAAMKRVTRGAMREQLGAKPCFAISHLEAIAAGKELSPDQALC